MVGAAAPLAPCDAPETGDPITDGVMLVATVAAAAGAIVAGGFVAQELTRRKDSEELER
jgi:hypothetical protein